MKCPKCQSEHTTIQAKEVKPDFTLPLCLVFGGLGLMFFGIGAIFGVLLGLVIGLILKSTLPVGYESILICQSCGGMTKINNVPNISWHPLFCTSEESDFTIRRNDEVQGIVVSLRIWIDDAPFDLSNGSQVYLKLGEGTHRLKYEQINGLGKKNRSGSFEINSKNEKEIVFSFTRNGINVNRSAR